MVLERTPNAVATNRTYVVTRNNRNFVTQVAIQEGGSTIQTVAITRDLNGFVTQVTETG